MFGCFFVLSSLTSGFVVSLFLSVGFFVASSIYFELPLSYCFDITATYLPASSSLSVSGAFDPLSSSFPLFDPYPSSSPSSKISLNAFSILCTSFYIFSTIFYLLFSLSFCEFFYYGSSTVGLIVTYSV